MTLFSKAKEPQQNKYYIAESSGNGVVMTSVDMHSPIVGASSDTKILHLDDFYNAISNFQQKYDFAYLPFDKIDAKNI